MAFPKILTSLPKHPLHPSPIASAQAQMQVAQEMDGVEIATELPIYLPNDVSGRPNDTMHYNQRTHDWIGEAYGRSAAGDAACDETIVYAPDPGEVQSLPSQVQCYGTSGTAYMLDAEWTEESAGRYVAVLSGNPDGT